MPVYSHVAGRTLLGSLLSVWRRWSVSLLLPGGSQVHFNSCGCGPKNLVFVTVSVPAITKILHFMRITDFNQSKINFKTFVGGGNQLNMMTLRFSNEKKKKKEKKQSTM